MTQEEKELLLKDLCARLFYKVKVQPSGSVSPHKFMGYDKGLVRIDTDQRFKLENIKPYLRPMSSMTDEEAMEYLGMLNDIDKSGLMNQNFITKVVDWLDKKMFDHRGLIPKGLALEATEGTYNN